MTMRHFAIFGSAMLPCSFTSRGVCRSHSIRSLPTFYATMKAMKSSEKRVLTPEQIALSEERKKRKAEAAAKTTTAGPSPRETLNRTWLTVDDAVLSKYPPNRSTTVMSWNMLAQCLVRRELFPSSDCLKAAQREGLLFEEITSSDADIICLQEVDRFDKLSSVLDSTGYAFTYACGPRKKHGCVIAYQKAVFTKVVDHTVFYDDEEIRTEADEPDERARKGSSFRTKNIGLISALRRLDATDQHVVVATTHLFWHPRYTYERARQAFLLIKAVVEFKRQNNLRATPTFIAGDFNFNPSDAAYSLLARDPLTTAQKAEITISRVIHVTIDPSIPIADPKKAAADGEEDGAEAEADAEGDDPDRVITNARPAGSKDGLFDAEELERKFAELPVLRSAYDTWRGPAIARDRIFGARTVVPEGRCGAGDPMYTSFTHYWKATLDYIFLLEDRDIEKYEVLGVLEPPAWEQLGSGLPRKGVCGSDHLSVRARVAWSLIPSVLELDQK